VVLKVDLSEDMARSTDVIAHLSTKSIAIEFYNALCNVEWKKINALPEDELIIEKLRGVDSSVWSCSWRAAGRTVAEIRNKAYNTTESYIDFYYSGSEGVVTDLVRDCFKQMGWEPHPYTDD